MICISLHVFLPFSKETGRKVCVRRRDGCGRGQKGVCSMALKTDVQTPWREELLAETEETVFLCDSSRMVEGARLPVIN